jgi:hypothetical protein
MFVSKVRAYLTHKHQTRLESPSETNDVAYSQITTVKSFITLGLGVVEIKLFMPVMYKFSELARVFVPGRPFWLSLMFVSKVRAYLSETPFSCSTLREAPGLTHKH